MTRLPIHSLAPLAGLVGALAVAPAAAQPDLAIAGVTFQGCDRATITLRNQGNQLANVITTAGFVAFPTGTPNLERYQKNVPFSAIGAGATLTGQVSGPAPISLGGKQRIFTSDVPHTVQVVADAGEQVAESNEDNNISTMSHTPSGCGLDEPADLAASFAYPTTTNLPGTYPAKFNVLFKNQGGEATPALDVELVRFNGSSASGAETEIGSQQSLASLAANGSKTLSWTDSNHPQTGTFTYAVRYGSSYSDGDDGNHTPSKSVTFTLPTAPTAGGGAGCDLTAAFTAPTGTTAPGGAALEFVVAFGSVGSGGCSAAKVKLVRYSTGLGGSSCTGYGSQVGGSGAWQSLPALAPGQSAQASFAEKAAPRSGTFCYKLEYSGAYNDTNNTNHRPQKILSFQ